MLSTNFILLVLDEKEGKDIAKLMLCGCWLWSLMEASHKPTRRLISFEKNHHKVASRMENALALEFSFKIGF